MFYTEAIIVVGKEFSLYNVNKRMQFLFLEPIKYTLSEKLARRAIREQKRRPSL